MYIRLLFLLFDIYSWPAHESDIYRWVNWYILYKYYCPMQTSRAQILQARFDIGFSFPAQRKQQHTQSEVYFVYNLRVFVGYRMIQYVKPACRQLHFVKAS